MPTKSKSAMMEVISNGEDVLAIILRREYKQDGIRFLTPSNYSQQLGYMNRPSGYQIAPHIHNPVKREVQTTNEALFIKSGRVRIDFYDQNQTYMQSEILEAGDVVLLVKGGHGFEMLEPTEMIEVKQGPYAGDEDKTRFDGISSDQAIFKP